MAAGFGAHFAPAPQPPFELFALHVSMRPAKGSLLEKSLTDGAQVPGEVNVAVPSRRQESKAAKPSRFVGLAQAPFWNAPDQSSPPPKQLLKFGKHWSPGLEHAAPCRLPHVHAEHSAAPAGSVKQLLGWSAVVAGRGRVAFRGPRERPTVGRIHAGKTFRAIGVGAVGVPVAVVVRAVEAVLLPGHSCARAALPAACAALPARPRGSARARVRRVSCAGAAAGLEQACRIGAAASEERRAEQGERAAREGDEGET